ncbi:MAG: YkgJ family cysteine cluster protein [Syntrophobacterales bacterium]|nr:YkgJ family cysteine cluster protein [Syntrophobacterales bacterium]
MKDQTIEDWSREDLKNQWLCWIDTIDPKVSLKEGDSVVFPKKRIVVQAEMTPLVKSIFARWERLSPSERFSAWEQLKEATKEAMKDVLPSCIQCGECCRKGSPVLRVEDLELLRTEKIPWSALYTIRSGEPVTSHDKGEVFFLVDERIKFREKEGSRECLFLDSTSSLCTIYEDRPLECRAQACWDQSGYLELENQPYLTRRDLFSHIEVLWDIIEAHRSRCGFERLYGLVKKLKESTAQREAEEIASKIIDLTSYESHFRSFMAEQLNIPFDILDLVFGRPLERLLELFGYRIRIEKDTKFIEIITQEGPFHEEA